MSQLRPAEPSVRGVDSETLRWAVDAARLVRNPVFPGAVFAAALVLAGFVVLVVSGWGASRQVYVALQVPYLISGGFAAVGLIVTGTLLASVLGNRRDEALADEEYDEVLKALTELARDRIRTRDAAGRDR